MAADQSGFEMLKIPLGGGGLKHVERVDAHLVADDAEFIHQGDVDVTLGVFNDFGRLSHTDARSPMCPRLDDQVVGLCHGVEGALVTSPHHLYDGFHRVHFVTWVDPLRAVRDKEIFAHGQPACGFQHGDTFVFGASRVDRALKHDNVSLLQEFAHRFRGGKERLQVGLAATQKRGGHGHDVERRIRQLRRVRGERHLRGFHLRCWHFPRRVLARLQGGHPRGIDVVPHNLNVFAKCHGDGKPNVAQPDHRNGMDAAGSHG